MATDVQIAADALYGHFGHGCEEAASAVVLALASAGRLRPAPTAEDPPAHGPGSLPHGYDGTCGDYCDNRECPAGELHERCTAACIEGAQ